MTRHLQALLKFERISFHSLNSKLGFMRRPRTKTAARKGRKKFPLKIGPKPPVSPYNSPPPPQSLPVELDYEDESASNPLFPLDTLTARRRGRPSRVIVSWVLGRAMDCRLTLGHCGVWAEVREKVMGAQTAEHIAEIFRAAVISHSFAEKFLRQPATLLEAIKHRDFPKRNFERQIAFIADSLAADGRVTARRSREICRAERAKAGRDADEWLPSWQDKQDDIWRRLYGIKKKRRSAN